jgi:hypothetical protein
VRCTRLDGGEVIVPCCNVFRLKGGLVAKYRSYIDATPVYSSCGIGLAAGGRMPPSSQASIELLWKERC